MSNRADRATAFLRRELAAGPRAGSDLRDRWAAEEGKNSGSVQQALSVGKSRAGVLHRLEGGPTGTSGPDSHVVWFLPEHQP